MNKTQALSGVIEGIYLSALEAYKEIAGEGAFSIQSLSVELSLKIEQKSNNKNELITNVYTKSKPCSKGITGKPGEFSSELKMTFVPGKCLAKTS